MQRKLTPRAVPIGSILYQEGTAKIIPAIAFPPVQIAPRPGVVVHFKYMNEIDLLQQPFHKLVWLKPNVMVISTN